MKKFLLTAMATAALSLPLAASADDIHIGILLGFTGPIESLTPDMAAGAELAMKEVSKSGLLLGGSDVVPVRADSTCVDA
ncbi:MAG: branched-chain amino acid ABC transporter substrate-binding protein, partial [Alphaproteobacteria bacterium]|nr:branched-chain amino acid ABC transporter substrate-binding protein [Alphaproteobacteria bacterium]